jgi:hypothetical protein
MSQLHVFRPTEGAVLDLESLQAVADASDQLLEGVLTAMWPGTTSVILDGLELRGELSQNGSPGTVRPDSRSEEVYVTPGTAIITGRNNRRYLIKVESELSARWPNTSGSGVQGALVLMPRVEASSIGESVRAAREIVTPVLGFVKVDQADAPFLVPIAQSVGNGRDWATDLRRLWQPEHASVRSLIKRMESLERTVWRAEPQGSVWDRQVLGRNWVRYQTVAASALQAARMLLLGRATSTRDRVRTLDALFESLHGSVESAADELLQAVGGAEAVGPYREVGKKVKGEG